MLEEYAVREGSDPRDHNRQRLAERRRRERALIAATPAARRPVVRALLAVAASVIPLRGEAKCAFLQSLDAARAAARRIGELLVLDGTLTEPDDVFYLTREELVAGIPGDARALVAWRHARREEHAAIDVPVHWRGQPPLDRPIKTTVLQPGQAISAIGVSPGVVEGRVRVVTDPTFADVEPDEILVAPTTDPSWSSIMFISAALVMDTGGALSHAAVVARELGIPCVVDTGDGSRRLQTGDRVRVDGNAGTVEVLDATAASAE